MGLFSRKKKKQQTTAIFAPPDPNTRVEIKSPMRGPALILAPIEENEMELLGPEDVPDFIEELTQKIIADKKENIEGEVRNYETSALEYYFMFEGEYQETITNENEDGWKTTKERTSINVSEPCGFTNFDDVIVNTQEIFDAETGEIKSYQEWLVPNKKQFLKMRDDWIIIGHWLQEDEPAQNIPLGRILYFIQYLHEFNLCGIDPNCQWNNFTFMTTMTIEGLTPTGKAKKYPISTSFGATRYGTRSNGDHGILEDLTLRSSYLKDGRIGKGEIIYWQDGRAWIAEFALDTKADEYYMKKVKTNIDAPEYEWRTLYSI